MIKPVRTSRHYLLEVAGLSLKLETISLCITAAQEERTELIHQARKSDGKQA